MYIFFFNSINYKKSPVKRVTRQITSVSHCHYPCRLARRPGRRYLTAGTDTPAGSRDATLAQGSRAATHRPGIDHDQVLPGPVRARPAISRRQQDEGRVAEGALLHDDTERTIAVHAEGIRANEYCDVNYSGRTHAERATTPRGTKN